MKRLKVGIEGVPFFGNLTGVGQYSKRLIEAASNLESNDHIGFEIVRSLMPHRKFTAPIQPNSNLSYRIIRWMPPIIYYQMFKRFGWAPAYDLVALRKYDIFIFFNFISFPVLKKTKSIVTIYDLSYIQHPQYTSLKNRDYLQKFVPRTLRNIDHIITISENSKHEIIEHYKIPEQNITVINPAVDHKLFRPQDSNEEARVSKKYSIHSPYILSVCTLEPRKNLIGVLEAFELLPEALKNKYTLVLVGGKGWLDGELEKKYEVLGKKYNLVKTGYVPNEDLPALYSGASIFVYPSFYEGFGMPPLEAMACGVPVITSNNSSLPEVVGSACILIKAEDTKELSKQIQRVLTDKQLTGSLREKGLKQAQKFNWEKSARKLLGVVEDLRT